MTLVWDWGRYRGTDSVKERKLDIFTGMQVGIRSTPQRFNKMCSVSPYSLLYYKYWLWPRVMTRNNGVRASPEWLLRITSTACLLCTAFNKEHINTHNLYPIGKGGYLKECMDMSVSCTSYDNKIHIYCIQTNTQEGVSQSASDCNSTWAYHTKHTHAHTHTLLQSLCYLTVTLSHPVLV